MSDFEDDVECLRIHLGGRLSESSQSGNDNELDEEYHLLRPSPIPADMIRLKSIYRPPSPVEDANNSDDPKKITKNSSAVKDKKERSVEFANIERVISIYLNVFKTLIKIQGDIISHSNKLCFKYLEVLEGFQINLDSCGDLLKNIDFESTVIKPIVPSDALVNVKNIISDINILRSHLYAFIISEYLLILSEAAKLRKSKVNSIVITTLRLINNVGDIDEINSKIQLRELESIVNPNFHNLVPLVLNNEDIISRLHRLCPKIDKNKKRRKKVNIKKATLEAYADYKLTLSSDKSNLEATTSKNVENDNNISGDNFLKYESSMIDSENHAIKLIDEADLSVTAPAPKKKRTKKNKKSMGDGDTMKMFETGNKSNDNNERKQNSDLHISDAKTKNCHTNQSHISDHIESKEMELSKGLCDFDTTSGIFDKMDNIDSNKSILEAKTSKNVENDNNISTNNLQNYESSMIDSENHTIKLIDETDLSVTVPAPKKKRTKKNKKSMGDGETMKMFETGNKSNDNNERKQNSDLHISDAKTKNCHTKQSHISDHIESEEMELSKGLCDFDTTSGVFDKMDNIDSDKSNLEAKTSKNVENDNNISSNNLQNYESSMIDSENHTIKLIDETDLSVTVPAPKKKRRKKNKKPLGDGETMKMFETGNKSNDNNERKQNSDLHISDAKTKNCHTNQSHISDHIESAEVELSKGLCYLDNTSEIFDKMDLIDNDKSNLEAKTSKNVENDNNISSDNLLKSESSMIDSENHTTKLIDETDLFITVPAPKKKRTKKNKKSTGDGETMKLFETGNSSKHNNGREQNSELHISDAKTYIGHTNQSHISDHIESEEMEFSKGVCYFDTTSQIFDKMDHNELKIVIFSMEILVKAISGMSILQYTMNTFEVKHTKSVIIVLNGCIKILKNLEYYNKLLFVLYPTELVKSLEAYYIPISELCLAHFYAYISNFCCIFVKTLKNQHVGDESKELNLQMIEVIKSLGSIQYIHNKLKFRNDNLYFQLAQKVCSLTPVISITSNNTEILQDLLQISNFSYVERLNELENIVQKRNDILQIVISSILTQKFHDIDNFQLDLKTIEILSILQADILNRVEYTTELDLLFEKMQNFLIILGQLDKQEGSEQESDSMIDNLSIDVNKIELATLTISTMLKKILNRCISKVFISHFYCFFLFMFVKFFNITMADKIKKEHCFHLELFEKLLFFCPLQNLPEKLEFRNDAICEKYMQILPIEGILVHTSSWNILNEALSVFKVISNIYRGYPYFSLHAQIDEFERHTLRTKKLMKGIDFSAAISLPMKKEREESKTKKKRKLLDSAESTEVFDIYDTLKHGKENKPNSKSLSINVDKDCVIPEKHHQLESEEIKFLKYQCNFNFSSKMFDKLDNKEMETIIISIEKIIEGINIMNILLYSMDTFEMKYLKSVITLLNDCTIILKNVSSYNNSLIAMCSKELLKVLETYYIPVLELYLAHSYAYLSYFCCIFIEAIRENISQGNSEEIYLHIIKVIESLGSFEYIHSKLQYRNDELYVELAQKVCLLTPIICSPASNIELLRKLSQIRNCPVDEIAVEFNSALENDVQKKNKDLQVVINTILPRKSQKVKNFQSGLKTVWILSVLQDDIYEKIRNSSELNSLCGKMRSFLNYLKELEIQEENAEKLDLDSLATDSILNEILNRNILRTIISQFYCFFLFIFVMFYNELSSGTEENQHHFNLDLMETLDSICPLQELPEKLEFRNDAIYEKYLKILHIQGLLIDRSSWSILNEVLTIFKMILKVDTECPPEELCARVEELERNTLWTEKFIEQKNLSIWVLSPKTKKGKKEKELPGCANNANVSEIEDISKDSTENKQNFNILNINDAEVYFDHKKEEGNKSNLKTSFSEKKARKRSKNKKNILTSVMSRESKENKQTSKTLKANDAKNDIDHDKAEEKKRDQKVLCIKDVENEKNESAVPVSSSRMEVTVVELLKACSDCDVKNILIEIMNNPEEADLSMNSVMRKIEYVITKAVTVLNIIQYSFNMYEKKYSIVTSFSLIDCFTLVRSLENFSSLLLSISASSKLEKIKTFFAPIAKMCQAQCYAYIVSTLCEFLRLLESDMDNTENEIYLSFLSLLEAFGSLENIYEKLKYRNDDCYIDIVRQLCTVIPATPRLADNEYILQNIPYIENMQKENKILSKILSKKVGIVSKNFEIRKLGIIYSEFECSQMDLKQLKIIMDLQYDINFHDQFPTNFYLVLENMINFLINLKTFEQSKFQSPAYGHFVDKFLQIAENILRLHISRILVAQFYSFIYSACIGFLKNLAELVPKNEVSFFRSKLINLFSVNCSIDEVFEKMQFRNDTIFSKYISDVLKMKMITVDKSYDEIHTEVLYILNMN